MIILLNTVLVVTHDINMILQQGAATNPRALGGSSTCQISLEHCDGTFRASVQDVMSALREVLSGPLASRHPFMG